MQSSDLPRSTRYANLASVFQPPGTPGAYISSSADPSLAGDYWRLFQAPGKVSVPPYESVYLEGILMGEAAAGVMRCYSEAGVQLEAAGPLPDHIAFELAFMAYLAQREEAQTTSAVTWRARQKRFLQEHLARWADTFCEQVLAKQSNPLFSQAACGVQQIIAEDLHRLAHPPKINRYPDIHLRLSTQSCTLCTFCVDNCWRGALSVLCTPETLSLSFDRKNCNGCRACVRLCTEHALTLEIHAPRESPVQEQAVLLFQAQRVKCPACGHAHIAQPWLERLAVQLDAGDSMRTSLELCPVCKASAQEGNLIQMRSLSESTRDD